MNYTFCGCEHAECAHIDQYNVPAGTRRALYVGRVCDTCASTCMAEYLIPVVEGWAITNAPGDITATVEVGFVFVRHVVTVDAIELDTQTRTPRKYARVTCTDDCRTCESGRDSRLNNFKVKLFDLRNHEGRTVEFAW